MKGRRRGAGRCGRGPTGPGRGARQRAWVAGWRLRSPRFDATLLPLCGKPFLLTLLVRLLRATCKRKDELILENLALRQQVTALKLGRYKPGLHDADRAFWVALRKTWANWAGRLLIVKPETVVDRQRRHFRRYWTRISQQLGGQRPGQLSVARHRAATQQRSARGHAGIPPAIVPLDTGTA